MNDAIFREYDIRGVYPSEINEDVAYKIGLGYGSFLQDELMQHTCVVSHDNRVSSPSLHDALIKGLLETGINVIDYGYTTTPMHYYARFVNRLYGIMITASHNPKDDNGFKFSFDPFANARGNMILNFKKYIEDENFKQGAGSLIKKDIQDEYIYYVLNHISLGERKVKIVLDPANGVTSLFARKIFEGLNIDLEIINEESDGTFPNHHPDPSVEENLDELKKKVIEVNADLGIGFDGDGDRIGIVDELGNLVSIEDYSILIIRDIIDKVSNKVFLYDAKSSDSFKDEVERLGGTAIISRTGSSYTMKAVQDANLPFGFQYVGHISFNDRLHDTESAMYSALRLVELLSKTNQKLSELVSTCPHYFSTQEEKFASSDEIKRTVIENIRTFCDKEGYECKDIDGLKVLFKTGWAYVRASNTGPNITLRCEAKNEEDLNTIHKVFKTLIDTYNK